MNNTYKITAASLVLLCCAQLPALAMTSDYSGTIGNKKVGLTFGPGRPHGFTADVETCGYYFYNDFLNDIALQCEAGSGNRRGDTVMYELNEKGERTAMFKCYFPETDPQGHFGKSKLDREVMVGTWSHLDGSGSLPVYLKEDGGVGAEGAKRYVVAGIDDDVAFEAKVQKWRKAVLAGDKKTVASMIEYPISTSVDGKQKRIASAAQLIANYDGVFTSKFVGRIRDAVPHNMFVRYDGVMLGGGGVVWFNANGKVSALNN